MVFERLARFIGYTYLFHIINYFRHMMVALMLYLTLTMNYLSITIRRMAENGFAPPPREFCSHILSCRELKAESFKRCLHSVLLGVSL